jgi:hypothetical protein
MLRMRHSCPVIELELTRWAREKVKKTKNKKHQVWWHTPTIPALRLREKDCEFVASLGWTVRPYIKKTNSTKKPLMY